MASLSIGEFAAATGLSVSALRFYDSVGLIAPAEIDDTTGYRRYTEDQIRQSVLVRDLRRLQMPIARIRELLEAPPDVRHKMVDDHLASMTQRLDALVGLAREIHSNLDEEEQHMTAMTVDAAELVQAIDQVLPAAGNDPERLILQAVLVEARDGSLRLVATDSYRLAVRDLVAREGQASSFRALVAAAGLARARASLSTEGQTSVELDDRRLRFGGQGEEVEIWVVPAEYPDYEAFFGSDPEAGTVTLEREALVGMLSRLDDDQIVKLELDAGGVTIVGQGPVPTSEAWTGPKTSVGFRAGFLLYAVGSSVGPEVRIEITTPIKPVLLRSATDGSFICLVMPIRLD